MTPVTFLSHRGAVFISIHMNVIRFRTVVYMFCVTLNHLNESLQQMYGQTLKLQK